MKRYLYLSLCLVQFYGGVGQRDNPFPFQNTNEIDQRDRDPFNPFSPTQTPRDSFGQIDNRTPGPGGFFNPNPFNPVTQRPFSNSNPFNNPFGGNPNQRDFNNPFNNPSGNINPQREFNNPREYNPPNFNFPNNRPDFFDNINYIQQEEKVCPPGWEMYKLSCLRFVRSPIHNRDDAQRTCQIYGHAANLVSINTIEKHSWIVRQLNAIDPQHRNWYTSVRQNSPGSWVNADNSQMINLDQAFLQDQPSVLLNQNNNILAYSFSDKRGRWGLLRVTGQDMFLFICEVPLSEVPYIVVDDRDFEYGLEILDPKKVPKGPYFIQQPENAVYDVSRNKLRSYVSLNCLAGGWPAPTYQWYREEYVNSTLKSIFIDPLANSKYTISGGTLIIESPKQKDDRGSYHCVASNEFGSIISESVSLSFGYIGEFILARSVELGQQYWGKAIYCDPPQHYPGVHYYWARKYFPNFVEEDQRVFVSYDGNLYISAVDMSDQDNYSCTVQSTVSDSGRNGPFFALQVVSNANYQQLKFPNNFPKAFPEAPIAGQEVRLECVAFGYPVPSYNWTRKHYGLPRGAIITNYGRVLTLKKVRVEDQGEYICRATNSRLSQESSVTLSIQAKPKFIIPLGDRHLDKGSDLQWTCEAFGIPDLSYQWYRNGRPLTPEEIPTEDLGRYLIRDSILTIRNLDEERDAGMYQCRANNSLAATFSSGQLRILLIRPSFKKRPLDIVIIAGEGGNVTIKCEPEAAPRPKFLWRKDGNLIGTGAGGKRRILPNGSLLINPVSRDDEGIYTCIAQNHLGTDESSGKVVVLRGPRLIEYPPDQGFYTVGGHLSLRCRADADDTLDIAYVWKHNGVRIDELNHNYHRILLDPRSGYLELYNLTLADKGEYECEVNTWVGKLRSVTRIEVKGPPGPPGGVHASELTSTSARITWTDGATNGAPSYYFRIEGRTQWDSEWRLLSYPNQTSNVLEDRNILRAPVEGRKEAKLYGVLSPWSTYEFRVSSANEFGYGPASFPSPSYNTPPDRPFIAPANVSGGGGKTGSLTITWDPLRPQDQNAPGIFYKIFWRRVKETAEDEYQTLELKKWGNIGMHVVNIPSMYYYTLYEVKVQAKNDMGFGPESGPEKIYTAEDMPQAAPSLVTPRPFNSTAINVTWIPVEETREKVRGKLIGYRIRYWPKIETNLYDPEAINYLSRSTEPWALIRGLQPNTYYYVQVSAYNAAGPGPMSEAQFERTLKKAPQKPPTAVTVIALDPSTIKVTWRYVAPSSEEEALLGYRVRIWEADQDISTANDTQVRIGSQRLQVTIENLQPGKMYALRVLAYSLGGDGKMSSPTQEFILGDPEALKSTGVLIASSSIFLSLMMTIFYIIY